LRGVHAP